MELKINKDLEKVIAKMFPEQYETLKNSIKEIGLKEPIEAMFDGTIVDGHHRYKACKELGIEPSYNILKDIKTLEQAKEYAVVINIARRHLNSFQKAEMGMALLEVEKELADKRGHGKVPASPNDETPSHGRTATYEVAKKIGLSEKTFERAKTVIEKAPEGIQDLTVNENLEIATAFRLVQHLDSEEHPVPDKKKEAFYEQVIDADEHERNKVLESVCKIVEETNTAKSLLEMTEEEIAKSIKADYKDKFYTEELMSEEIRHAIAVAEGQTPKQKVVYVPWENFENADNPELAAENFFKKYGGGFEEKVTIVMTKGKVDPYKWKKREEEE